MQALTDGKLDGPLRDGLEAEVPPAEGSHPHSIRQPKKVLVRAEQRRLKMLLALLEHQAQQQQVNPTCTCDGTLPAPLLVAMMQATKQGISSSNNAGHLR